MKKLFFLGLICSALLFTSCNEVEEDSNSDLSFSVSGQAIVLPDTSEYRTCYGDDISGTRFSWKGLDILWKDKYRDLSLIYLKVEINETNVGGEFSTVISDEVLGEILQYIEGDASVTVSGDYIPAPTETTLKDEVPTREIKVSSRCRVHVVGLGIVDQDENFNVTAKLTLFGLAVGNQAGADADVVSVGDESPVRATATAKVIYNLN